MPEKKSIGPRESKPAQAKPVAKRSWRPMPETRAQQTTGTWQLVGINWDVLGFSSAAFTLLGTAMLFLLGWAYEVNWYGYFGVSMGQVNSLPQNIFIQSIPSIVTLLASLVTAILCFMIGETTFRLFRNAIVVNKYFSPGDWIAVLLATELILLISLYLSSTYISEVRFGKINQVYEIIYLNFAANLVGIMFGGFLVGTLVVVIGFVLKNGVEKVKLISQIGTKRPQNVVIVFLIVTMIIFTSMSISAVYGINDAARGIRGSGGWNIQPMYLVTKRNLFTLESLSHTCVDALCISGPFGLIGESASDNILINWKGDTDTYFRYQPGLYIIPKSETTYLIPFVPVAGAPAPQPSSTARPTLASTTRPPVSPNPEVTTTPSHP